jgi:hypothetical protein
MDIQEKSVKLLQWTCIFLKFHLEEKEDRKGEKESKKLLEMTMS